MTIKIRDDRQMRAMTGLSQAKFAELLPVFSQVYQQEQQQTYEQGLAMGTRQRQPGGGQKGKLPRMQDKLLFILTYYKTYPTFDVLGAQFNMARSKANENVHKLSPILHDTLVQLGVLPHRQFESVAAFKEACQGLDQLIIDVTERPHQRPQDDEQQRDLYSGKKTTHRQKHHHLDPG
jgi:hypothetical protein